MDWDKLRIFYMVAKAGSFTHAGNSLNLSQSAVSRHISSFEEELGLSLFHRHARGLVLTEPGEMLYEASQDIFSRMMAIESHLSDSRDSLSGPLTVTIAEFFGTSWLAHLLGEFHSKYPEIRTTVLMDDRILNLGLREADVAIRLYKPEQQDLIQRHIVTMTFAVCASRAYLERCGTPKNFADLAKHTLIAYPSQAVVPYSNPNWLIDQLALPADSAANVLAMNSLSAIAQAIYSGAGIGVLPHYMIEREGNLVNLSLGAPPPSVEVYFVYSEDRLNSRRIGVFRDFLVEKVSATPF